MDDWRNTKEILSKLNRRLCQLTPIDSCPVDELLSGDDDLTACAGMTDDLDSSFLEQLGEQEDDDDPSAPSPPPPSPKLKSFKEAINALENVSFFLGASRSHERS